MHQINNNQANLSPFHDEFEVNLTLIIHNLMVDSIREYHKFVGLEFDDEKFVGFVGTVRGDFDHTPYQEDKCPHCDCIIPCEGGGSYKVLPELCPDCKKEINLGFPNSHVDTEAVSDTSKNLKIVCNDLCPVCHPKKYSTTHAVKGCGNCNHFDVTGESETPFSDGKIPETLVDAISILPPDRKSCHGNINADMQPCEYWKISVIKCGACDAEHIGLPDWCGVCGERLAVEV